MERVALLIAFTIFPLFSGAQINVQLLHQLVGDNQKEYHLQLETKNSQAKTTAHEDANWKILEQVKDRYKIIQGRFATLYTVFDAAGIGATATSIIKSIIENQEQILFYCQVNPELIPLAIKTEEVFVKRSHSLLNYLIGLSTVIGEINQMKVSERRILFQHIITELREIHQISLGVSNSLNLSLMMKTGMIPHYPSLHEDLGTVDAIINQIQSLKN